LEVESRIKYYSSENKKQSNRLMSQQSAGLLFVHVWMIKGYFSKKNIELFPGFLLVLSIFNLLRITKNTIEIILLEKYMLCL